MAADAPAPAAAAAGVFVRFQLIEPEDAVWHVQLGGFIHNPNWHLPAGVVPAGADRDAKLRVKAGEHSPWFDLGKHCGPSLHGRLNRAGGVAEFPNVTARFVAHPAPAEPAPFRVVIELATAAKDDAIVKRFEEAMGMKPVACTSSRRGPEARRLSRTVTTG